MPIADAKFFAIPDPPPLNAVEDKTDESIVERPILHAAELPQHVVDREAIAGSSSGSANEALSSRSEDISVPNDAPPLASQLLEADHFAQERAEHDAVLAVVAAHDQLVSEASSGAGPDISPQHERAAPDSHHPRSMPNTAASVDIEVTLPVGHAYYFIQVFDAESQVLQTVGSFFSQLEANVKASIRKHLQWPVRRDFLLWKRIDGTTVSTVSPAESFADVVLPHGSCIIVGDKLSKER